MGASKRVPTPAAEAAAGIQDETTSSAAGTDAGASSGGSVSDSITPADAVPTAANTPDASNPADEVCLEGREGQLTECRVLLSFQGYEANDVIELDADELVRFERSGHVDSDENAVAYAKSLLA